MAKFRRAKSTKNGIPVAYAQNGEIARGDTTAEVLTNAGLDWQVKMEPLFDSMGQRVHGRNIPTHRIYREDTNQTFGAVTSKYATVQNAELFAIADSLCDSDWMNWDRVGSRNNGQEVWGSFQLKEGFQIKGVDWIDSYIYLRNSNDGNGGLNITPMNIRPVCTNQYAHISRQIREAGFNLKDLTIRHSSKMEDRIRQAIKGVQIVDSLNEQFVIKAEQLMEVSLDLKERESFYSENLGLTTQEKNKDKNNRLGLTTRGQNKLDAVFAIEDHANNSAIKGTAWGVYNTLTQFIDHNSIVNANGDILQSRVDSAMFGTMASTKAKAFDNLLEVSQIA